MAALLKTVGAANTEQPGGAKQDTSANINANEKDDEKDEKKQESMEKTALDVVFVLDCTASMNSYIQSCKDNINSISTKIIEEVDNCNVQFALVLYRDIPPQDRSFITKKIDFTPIPFKIQIELETISASGGGDYPEALTSALYDCHHNLKWRNDAIKVIIVITDAPPHGLEKKLRDGFPKGDIDTFNVDNDKEGDKDSGSNKYLNIIEIIQCIRDDLKAAIYSVACEPDLSCNTDFANDFMQYMAEYTKGRFLPLSSAKLLPQVIVGSVKQQITLKRLKNNLDEEIKKIKEEHGQDISAEELNKIIREKWKAAGVKKKEISIGTLYRKKRSRVNIELLMNGQKIKSLDEFKANCTMLTRLKQTDFRHLDKNKNKKKKKKVDYDSNSESEDEYDDADDEDEDEDYKDDASLKTKIKSEDSSSKAGGALFGADDDEDEDDEDEDWGDDSDSCASQAYYSESCSLEDADIQDMMD